MSAVDAVRKEGNGQNVETQPVTRRFKAPNPKFQAPEKLQAPNPNLTTPDAVEKSWAELASSRRMFLPLLGERAGVGPG